MAGGRPGRPRKVVEEWITTGEAAEIMTRNSGHEVGADYVRYLGSKKRLRSKPLDSRTKLYLKSDIEAYRVGKPGRPRKQQEPAPC